MLSTKPYLIRAIYEWCEDQDFTPHLSVQVDEHTRVPRSFVRNGQIILNISSTATHQLMLGNDEISFQARFNAASFPVVIPVDAVIAVFAMENRQGLVFKPGTIGETEDEAGDEAEDEAGEEAASEKVDAGGTADGKTSPRRGGHLTRIK